MRKNISTNFIYFFGALGGLLFGYDTGVISGAILFIKKQWGVNDWWEGVIVSAVLIGAIIGAVVIGPLSDKYGRKKLILVGAVLFFIGALASGLSPNYILLILSRVILGVAVGAASALIPTYLAEISPKEKRGSIGTLFQLMIVSGILLAYISNDYLQHLYYAWRIMLILAIIPALLLFLGGLKLPESPRYMVRKNDLDSAKKILGYFEKDESKIETELQEIQEQAKKENGGIKELFSKLVRPSLIMGIGLMGFQQIMGCNTVIYYAPDIFTKVGFGVSAALLAHIGIGILNFAATWLAIAIINKIDRKKILIAGSLGMFFSLTGLGLGMQFSSSSSIASYIAAIALTVYIIFFAFSWGAVAWVMIGEVFPLNIRGLGNSFSAMINWSANTIVCISFPSLLTIFGAGKVFYIYAIACLFSILFVAKLTIETRGRSLEQIEKSLRDKLKKENTKIA